MSKVSVREYNTLVNKYDDIYKENQELKQQINSYKSTFDEIREIIINSEDYQIIKAMKLISEQSLWIKMIEILDKVKGGE